MYEMPITVGVMCQKSSSLAMASCSQVAYSYEDLIKNAEVQKKTHSRLWCDLREDLQTWQKVTDWLKVSVVSFLSAIFGLILFVI